MPVGFREFYPIGTPTPQRRLPLTNHIRLNIDSSICEVDFVVAKKCTLLTLILYLDSVLI